MPSAFCSQLPPAAIIFHHQARTEQERLRHLRNGAGGQANPRSNHVEPAVAFSQDAEILLLDGSQAQAVDAFKIAGSVQVAEGDGVLPLGAADTAANDGMGSAFVSTPATVETKAAVAIPADAFAAWLSPSTATGDILPEARSLLEWKK